MAVNKLYEQFCEAVNLPDKRRRQAEAEAKELKQATAAAKKAFEQAEIEGQESAALFETWQELAGKLKLAEARAEALQEAAPGKQAAEAAARLIEAAHAEVESLQASKREQEAKLSELKELYIQELKTYLEKQQRQIEVAGMVNEAREQAPGAAAIMLRQYFKDLRAFEISEQVFNDIFGVNNRAAFSLTGWKATGA